MSFEILSPSAQVAGHLRELIIQGQWGDELPGTPTLSQETGIDRKTITAAIHLLEKEGILLSPGLGKRRRIMVPEARRKTGLKVTLLLYEERERTEVLTREIVRRLVAAGHTVHLARRTLTSMNMDLDKVSRYLRGHPADLWIPKAASKEILEWMAVQDFATLALFGRRRQVDIAAVGPDKIQAMRDLTGKLITLGHKRIVLFVREERRHPNPGLNERVFLETLEEHGIQANVSYHLPEWTSNADGFKQCMDELFRYTPPTALIVEESQFFFSALQQLAARGLSAPEQVSIACTDNDPVFEMSHPTVTCIDWRIGPVIDHIVRWVRKASRGRISRKQKLTPAQIIEGGTIGPAPAHDNLAQV